MEYYSKRFLSEKPKSVVMYRNIRTAAIVLPQAQNLLAIFRDYGTLSQKRDIRFHQQKRPREGPQLWQSRVSASYRGVQAQKAGLQ
jgi:hypothetical protein